MFSTLAQITLYFSANV